MEQKVTECIRSNFKDYKVSSEIGKDKKTITITARNGWMKGFEITLKENNKVSIGFSSKVRTIGYVVALVLTLALTMIFGFQLLDAFGFVADMGNGRGVTIRILYIIPLLIFLIPSMILTSLIARTINPKDKILLEQVKNNLSATGIESTIE